MNSTLENNGISVAIYLSDILPDATINSRSHDNDQAELEALAKNINEIGLVLPLSVRRSDDGTYAIMDGHRRHAALHMVAEWNGVRPDDYLVPVLVREADNADARTLSLAANIMRLPLHPADQFEAFKALLSEGVTREAIASRFALTLKEVDQRLALGGVIPEILRAYRADDIGLDSVKKLASVSEARQREVWEAATKEGNVSGWQIDALLCDKTIHANSRIAQFVGLPAYLDAGGFVEVDLFRENANRWLDPQIATKLAETAAAKLIDKLKADGWAWVMREQDLPEGWKWQSQRLEAKGAAPDTAEGKRLAEIEGRLAEIDEIDADDLTAEEQHNYNNEVGVLEDERDTIEQATEEYWPAEDKAKSGVVITADYDVQHGVVWPEKKGTPEQTAAKAEAKKEEVKGWSASLIAELEVATTAAAQLAVLRNPALAEHMLIATLYLRAINQDTGGVLALSAGDFQRHPQVTEDIDIYIKGFNLMAKTFWPLVDAIGKMHPDTRDGLRAALVARLLRTQRFDKVDSLLCNFEADLSEVWRPDAAFFERLTTAQLSEVHKEITGFGIENTKKKDAVEKVAKIAAEKRWVPKQMRMAMPVDKQPLLETKKPKAKTKKAA